MKKQKISKLTNELLDNSIPEIRKNIEKALNSGAIDIDNWDENINSMIMPKIILLACLQAEINQYSAMGTSFEKEVKKEVKNLGYFI